MSRFRNGKKTGGHIVVLRGAPGADKTSLSDEIAAGGVGGIDPITTDLPRKTLQNINEVVWQIGNRLFPKEIKKPAQKKVAAARRLGFADLGDGKLRKRWDRLVCLAIDEIQGVTKEAGDCRRELYLGEHGLPIVTICAGLANSAERMQRAMSPRLAAGNLLTLGALAPDEVQASVEKMLDLGGLEHDFEELRRGPGKFSAVRKAVRNMSGTKRPRYSENWPKRGASWKRWISKLGRKKRTITGKSVMLRGRAPRCRIGNAKAI